MNILDKLEKSKFRSRFKLNKKDIEYVKEKGIEVIRRHAQDFIRERIAPAFPLNDGKQTPMKGHPVFKAQHATATCCRNCIENRHKFPKGVQLSEAQQKYLVSLIMEKINRDIERSGESVTDIPVQTRLF